MEYKDYYQTLGVAKTASEDEIKKAYRKLVRKYHPDVSKEADAQQKTQEINEAYGVLGDAEKRAAYDELGRGHQYRAGQEFRPPPDWGRGFGGGPGGQQGGFGGAGGFGDSDFFSDLFANFGGGGGRRRQAPQKGDDSHASITIDLSDTYQGATRTISLMVAERDPHDRIVTRERNLSVNIPKGVTAGQQLRLSGQGQQGAAGPGDLYLEIQFRPHPRYRIDGRDVYQTVPVAPWELALGGEIEVSTPSGKVNVTVPAGSQSGRKLRLRGRGIPGKEIGDLYLLLEVVLPPADSEAAKQLYQTMAREMAFNPRTGG
ncbi:MULTISPECIES: DnaJ C-terminal domain-containing protein [unclassified Duganella]|uniref:DnaJ C-terminal domain-containing protein n=1 Tax=unclassified Duganella TaxID=2636909 RepID=UPI0008801C28|nr:MULTISPECIES: DnaJ C-terminal domain-containing protein [unclassified Duganella]SDH32091.1 curved DNA-binding protein [Duganella sp. OV458]SDK48881.1 curved DNA-binding protein [Duganella sp. OV510]